MRHIDSNSRCADIVQNGFALHKTLEKLLQRRQEMIETGKGIDWSMAEALALGTLLHEKFGVRFSGQDVERGTFSHHAAGHGFVVDSGRAVALSRPRP